MGCQNASISVQVLGTNPAQAKIVPRKLNKISVDFLAASNVRTSGWAGANAEVRASKHKRDTQLKRDVESVPE